MALLHRVALATLPLLPGGIMRRLASRYIAGEQLEDALACLQELAAEGYLGALDLLGEDVENEAEARDVLADYETAGEALNEHGLDAYLSVKPTHLGLRISEELCFDLYQHLVRRAEELDTFVRVEMEDHTTTDATLRIFERLHAIAPKRVGIVLQSRLFRTTDDIAELPKGPMSVRMVKGIYLEPPAIAHVDAEPIRAAFVEQARLLWEREAFVALATHDELMANRLIAVIRELGVGRERYEFQVLLGVRQMLWKQWKAAGHPVRVYVPYGPNWRAYSTRRLQKNPQIFRHVMGDLVLRR